MLCKLSINLGGVNQEQDTMSMNDFKNDGDTNTIFSIACEYGDVDPYAIILANSLSEPYKVTLGESQHIP